MHCARCGRPLPEDGAACGCAAGARPQNNGPSPEPEALEGRVWQPPESPFPAGQPLPPPVDHPEASSLSAWECLRMLLLGLLPLAGLAACLLWAYGDAVATQRRNLARAMLYIHAGALALLLVGLALWVGRLLFAGG